MSTSETDGAESDLMGPAGAHAEGKIYMSTEPVPEEPASFDQLRLMLGSKQQLLLWLHESGVERIYDTVGNLASDRGLSAMRDLFDWVLPTAQDLKLSAQCQHYVQQTDGFCEGSPTDGHREDNAYQHNSTDASSPQPASQSQALDWVGAILAAALPLMYAVLPRDARGICIMPHKHPLVRHTVPDNMRHYNMTGCLVWESGKACDNCDQHIADQHYWSCSHGRECQIDFCVSCHEEMQSVFSRCDMNHVEWALGFITGLSQHIMRRCSSTTREGFVSHLASHWPASLFEQLVAVFVDVANASVVHIEDNAQTEDGVARISEGLTFWDTVAVLQLLYAANRHQRAADCSFLEGPKIPPEQFVLEGINKCEAISDWKRWHDLPLQPSSEDSRSLVMAEPFETSERFTCFLTHCNLIPVAFRRECIKFDWYEEDEERFAKANRIEVVRSPIELTRAGFIQSLGSVLEIGDKVKVMGLVKATDCNGKTVTLKHYLPENDRWRVVFQDKTEKSIKTANITLLKEDGEEYPPGEHVRLSSRLGRPIRAKFKGEPASGPGVTREFIQLALESALSHVPPVTLWEYSEEVRTYWFAEPEMDTSACEAYRACGALLGHAIVTDTFLPPVFPQAVYMLLLKKYGSPKVSDWSLNHLAQVSPKIASGLESLIEYEGDDAHEIYELDWPGSSELVDLPAELRSQYVQRYVEWYLDKRLIRTQVTAAELETIICGVEEPMDVIAVKANADLNNWTDEDAEYIAGFWDVLAGFSREDSRSFAVFVSASTRMPLQGWSRFKLQVQKNGTGDDRLPTAYTCFSLLLLPRYSSTDVLREKILEAIHETKGFGLN